MIPRVWVGRKGHGVGLMFKCVWTLACMVFGLALGPGVIRPMCIMTIDKMVRINFASEEPE